MTTLSKIKLSTASGTCAAKQKQLPARSDTSWVLGRACHHQGCEQLCHHFQASSSSWENKGLEVPWDLLQLCWTTCLKHLITWHILSCNLCLTDHLGSCSSNQKSKPGSWFISKSVTSESASSWEPGPRVLLLWQPLFLLWNVSSKGKQDNIESQAGTGAPAFRLRPAVLCPQPACYTPEGLYRGALESLATDQGTSLFKAYPGWVMWKLPTTSFFFFFSYIVSIY